MGKSFRTVSWDEYTEAVGNLVRALSGSHFHSWPLVGIARGGLIPAVILSHGLDGQTVYPFGIQSYTEQTKGEEQVYDDPRSLPDKFILVDDILDSGGTLTSLDSLIKADCPWKWYVTAIVYDKAVSGIQPDFWGGYIDPEAWVVFPYEQSG